MVGLAVVHVVPVVGRIWSYWSRGRLHVASKLTAVSDVS